MCTADTTNCSTIICTTEHGPQACDQDYLGVGILGNELVEFNAACLDSVSVVNNGSCFFEEENVGQILCSCFTDNCTRTLSGDTLSL